MKQTTTTRIKTHTHRAHRTETSRLSHVASLAEAVVKTSLQRVARRRQMPHSTAECFMLTERDITTGVYNFLP